MENRRYPYYRTQFIQIAFVTAWEEVNWEAEKEAPLNDYLGWSTISGYEWNTGTVKAKPDLK